MGNPELLFCNFLLFSDIVNMTDDTFVQNLRDLFKDKRILIIGDSIMRGIYKDICCVLSNNSRLLYDYELKFNRHNVHANILFGEQIESFHFNRNNSTFNKEKRIFKLLH
jgi:hypothetical protein